MIRLVLALLLLVFEDGEIPRGSGTRLLLAHAPNPPKSLQLFRNGLLQAQTVDYTLAGASVTLKTPMDVHASFRCFYRH